MLFVTKTPDRFRNLKFALLEMGVEQLNCTLKNSVNIGNVVQKHSKIR